MNQKGEESGIWKKMLVTRNLINGNIMNKITNIWTFTPG